jgi:hypothetical protein
VNIFATPPIVAQVSNIKYCPLCYQHHGLVVVGEIERGPSNYCAKHYRIQSSRNRALNRKLYAASLKELEEMIPADMKCRLCNCTMGYSIREVDRNHIMSLQHWRSGKLEWICLRCNTSHGSTQEPDDKWIELQRSVKEHEKFCQLCKKVKDVAFFYKTSGGSKGLSAYCKLCHDEYIRNKRQPKQSNICP